MKLYEAPRNVWLWVPVLERKIFFHRIDGMYSYCTDDHNNVIHLAADVEVEVLGEGGDDQSRRLFEIRLPEPEPEPDLEWCPMCGGPADNGHDRCYPPNPYMCSNCAKA